MLCSVDCYLRIAALRTMIAKDRWTYTIVQRMKRKVGDTFDVADRAKADDEGKEGQYLHVGYAATNALYALFSDKTSTNGPASVARIRCC